MSAQRGGGLKEHPPPTPLSIQPFIGRTKATSQEDKPFSPLFSLAAPRRLPVPGALISILMDVQENMNVNERGNSWWKKKHNKKNKCGR